MSEPEEKIEEKSVEAEKAEESTVAEEKEEEESEVAEAAEAVEEEKIEELPEETMEEGEGEPSESLLEEEAEKVVEEGEEKPKREEELEDIVEEKFYTIPLRRAWITPPKKRAPRAIRIIRSFIEKHMKIGAKKVEGETEEEMEERLIISSELNEKIWRRGIEKPPRRVKVRAVRDSEGNVTVYPAEGD